MENKNNNGIPNEEENIIPNDKGRYSGKRRKLSKQEEKWKKTAFMIFGLFLFLFVGQIIFYAIVWNVNDWVCVLIIAMVLIAPAYLANAGMLIWGGGKPLDGGKISKDGRRLFGPGKTIRGFVLGPLGFGIPIALLIHGILIACWGSIEPFIVHQYTGGADYVLYSMTENEAIDLFKLYLVGAHQSETILQGLPRLILRVVLTSYGAALGDLIGSWAKRRTDRKRGEPLWFVDQLDFTVPVLLFALPFVGATWQFLTVAIFTMIFAPSLTIFANTMTYLTGHKAVPY